MYRPILVSMGVLILFGMVGCAAKLPRQTAEMQIVLGRHLGSAKRSHIKLIEMWADEAKKGTDAILRYHWSLDYIKKFLNFKAVKKDMDKVVCSKAGELDRAVIIYNIVEAISKTIEQKRSSLFELIEKERRKMIDGVVAHYASIEAMHNTISTNINSVVNVQKIEAQLRTAMLKPIEDIVPIDEASEKINELLK